MYNESYNNFTSQTKPLNITFMLIIIVAVMIVGILSYGIVRYYDFKKLQEVVCEEHRVLKKDLQKIKNNNDSLKNKKKDFNTHLNTYNNQNCIGEWINPDETNCEEVYKISQIKMGDGTPCEYEHDEKRERRETDGVCEPQNCVGEWNNCIRDERTYSVTTPALRGGSCPAENGAIDRTTCVIQNRPPPNISSDDIQTTLSTLGSSPTDEEIANKLANEYTQYDSEDFLNMISSLGSNATLQEKIDAFAKIDDPDSDNCAQMFKNIIDDYGINECIYNKFSETDINCDIKDNQRKPTNYIAKCINDKFYEDIITIVNKQLDQKLNYEEIDIKLQINKNNWEDILTDIFNNHGIEKVLHNETRVEITNYFNDSDIKLKIKNSNFNKNCNYISQKNVCKAFKKVYLVNYSETGPGTASDGTNISSDDIQTTLSTLGSSPTNQEIADTLNAEYSHFPIQEILNTISSLGSNATLQEKIDAIATIDDPETGPGSVSDDPETPSDVVGNNDLKTPVITLLTKALSNLPFFVNDLLS